MCASSTREARAGVAASGGFWERTEGAASRPLRCGYARREPEKTVLHALVREELETFLATLASEGQRLPRYVEQELRRYLPCGLISEGFARVACRSCGDEILVAFSCKGRAFCPSCCSRRMSDTAAHLMDRVLPPAPYRHWVLSYPWRVRWMLARDAKAATASGRVLAQEVFRWQRRKARQAGLPRGKTGAVLFTQRFGSTINVNVHHHSVVPDGVFVENDDASVRFEKLPAPRVGDLERILGRVVRRTMAMLSKRHLLDAEPEDALGTLQAEAVQTGLRFAQQPGPERARLAAFLDGFSLEAGRHLHENDREGPEALARYCLRPPVAQHRLSMAEDGTGDVVLKLKRPLADGRVTLPMTPLALLRRLAGLVPVPRCHQVHYYGGFAPHANLRSRIVPRSPKLRRRCHAVQSPTGQLELALPTPAPRLDGGEVLPLVKAPMPRPREISWASLLRRTFATEILACQCGGRREVVAFVRDRTEAMEILERLGLPSQLPQAARARGPPQQDELFDGPPDDCAAEPAFSDRCSLEGR